MARWYRGDLAQAEAILQEARSAARDHGRSYSWVTASIYLNKAALERGRLREAQDATVDLIRTAGKTPILALAHYDLSWLCYERNDLAAAAACIEEGLAVCAAGGCGDLQAVGHADLARLRQAQGRPADASDQLRQAGELLRGCGPTPAAKLHYLRMCLLVALAQGDLDAAGQAALGIPGPAAAGSVPDYLPLCLAQTRLSLARGRRREAAGLASEVQATADRCGLLLLGTTARAERALAASGLEEALPLVAEARASGERAGLGRTFLDCGEPMRQLLAEALARGMSPTYVSHLLRGFATPGDASSAPLDAGGRAPAQPEAISEREAEVLRLLAGGITNDEIAARLVVSANTVKTHLASIYGKLGVNDRRAAVAAGRRAGLLP